MLNFIDSNIISSSVIKEKKLDYNICHKTYSSLESLRQHKIIHDDTKSHKCNVCKKVFNCKALLNTHMRIHTKEKPYVCPTCKRGFTTKFNLQSHQKTHSKEQPRKYLIKDDLTQKSK